MGAPSRFGDTRAATKVLPQPSTAKGSTGGLDSSWPKGPVRPTLPQLNSRFGHFELLKFLGRGGMGEVFQARDTRLDRLVALKLLLPGPTTLSQRFQREARAQARIEHDAVCSVFEVGNADGRPFIAMQYLDGQTLGEAAAELTLEEKVLVIRQVAAAVHAAHTQALVHRDLKPGNIMVQRTDSALKAWVLDFGMVQVSGDAQLTSTGEMLGTPCYMAPEQIEGEAGVIDRRTDVYGLGAVFYEILTGRPPFEGKNVLDLIRKAATEAPPAPRELRSEIPEDLEWIVLRCLEKNPGHRYGSARALIEDLDRFRLGEPVLARQSTWRYRWAKRLRQHWRILAAAAVALALAISLVWRDLAQRQAASEASQLTSYFLREKKELEWRLRAISTLPLHDTRPERDRLLKRLNRLEEEVLETGEVGEGPGFFAVGRVHQVLGSQDKGLDYLQRAWEKGFRDPRLSFSLGVAYSELYENSLARLALEPDPQVRRQRTLEAWARYREPAIARLEEARQGRSEDSEWVAARVAAREERWDDAFGAIAEVAKSSPWLYETQTLKASIRHRQALEAAAVEELSRARELLERAGEAAQAAIRLGESDPATYLELCSQRETWIAVLHQPLPASSEERWRLLRPCQQAIAADSGAARSYAIAAITTESLGEALMYRERDPASAVFFEEAARLAAEALKRDPEQVLALEELAEARLHLAELADRPEERDRFLEQALEGARRLRRVEPDSLATALFFAFAARVQSTYLGDSGEDVAAAFEGAARALAPLVRGRAASAQALRELATLESVRARWLLRRGTDISKALDRARYLASEAALRDAYPLENDELTALVCQVSAEADLARGDLPDPPDPCWQALDRLLEVQPKSAAWAAARVRLWGLEVAAGRADPETARARIEPHLRTLEADPLDRRRTYHAEFGRWLRLTVRHGAPGTRIGRLREAAGLLARAADSGRLEERLLQIDAQLMLADEERRRGRPGAARQWLARSREALGEVEQRDPRRLRVRLLQAVAARLESELDGRPGATDWVGLIEEPFGRAEAEWWRERLEASST